MMGNYCGLRSAPTFDPVAAAECTKNWLAISGPRYREEDIIFRNLSDWQDESAILSQPEFGNVIIMTPHHMSFASWLMCREARPGKRITLKIRSDQNKGVEKLP